MAKIEKKNEYNKSFCDFRALASATAISEMAISLQIYNLLSNLPKNYQKEETFITLKILENALIKLMKEKKKKILLIK